MAVYKLFPDKDAFIFTEDNLANTGLDEILEIGGFPILGVGQASRALIKFSTTEIQGTYNLAAGSAVSASLKLSLADAYETPTSHSVYAYPVYQYWDQGIGKFGDVPQDTSGAGWKHNKASLSEDWDIPFNAVLPTGVTASYSSNYPGGGNWYTGSNGINLEASQSFEAKSKLDLNLDVTNTVELHFSESLDNNGFIIKLDDSLEFSTDYVLRHKYFSSDTNTIYPPVLELKWDDSVYSTSLTEINNTETVVQVSNNTGEYKDEGKARFRLLVRPRFPQRQFTTAPIYKTKYALPQESYWGIKDEFTEEMVIDFDNQFTKISCDNSSPYFDVYMDGLQPERYYRILIKTTIDGNTFVTSDNNSFKVVRNV